MDKLTIEEITRLANNDFQNYGLGDSAMILANQLLDTMRALKEIADNSEDTYADDIARKALGLKPYKELDN